MLFGLDIASVDDNKNANWQLAKAHGPISFALIRANQSTTVDPQFSENWPLLKSTGLVRGAYMFLDFPKNGKNVAAPDVQAQTLIDTVGALDATDLPPTLDIEFPAGRKATGMTAEDALAWARTAWSTLRDHYKTAPIIYTSARVWHEDLDDLDASDLVDAPLWLARYYWKEKTDAMRDAGAFSDGKKDPPVPGPWGSAWAIHQYQGDALNLPGFSSTVDMNRFNALVKGSTGDMVKWVQRRLGITESGTLDTTASAAVTTFQQQKNLVADGIVGPRTFAALCWNSLTSE